MKLYHTRAGVVLQQESNCYLLSEDWQTVVNRSNLYAYLIDQISGAQLLTPQKADELLQMPLAPLAQQEVWAAGVTYLRSMEARVEESQESGFATLYDKVYVAERPELFFKAQPHKVAATQSDVYIRKDSTWNVPEPELTLFINSHGEIQGYTIGNDMSSRSIEGENALYLPQAKIWDNSAALGPCLLVAENPIDPETTIEMEIVRSGQVVFKDGVKISRMKRKHTELVEFLYRENSFPFGCYLMTGTCLVPDNDFTLSNGDVVKISISGIGSLVNTVNIKA